MEQPSDHDREGRTAVDLQNSSEEPVYGVVVGLVLVQGTAPHSLEEWLTRPGATPEMFPRGPITTISTLPNGLFRTWIRGYGWHRMLSGRLGAEIAFTDRNASHWIRRSSGQLEELTEEPIAYFEKLGMHGPHDLQTPERIG